MAGWSAYGSEGSEGVPYRQEKKKKKKQENPP